MAKEKEVIINTPSDFGVFFRNRRRSLRLNQQEIGRIIGISAQTINAWETGRSRTPNMTIIQVKRMLSLFKISIYEVPNGEDSVLEVDFDVDADIKTKMP